MSSPQHPASPASLVVAPATVVECDQQQLVLLFDDGTRRSFDDPSALGIGGARRGQRILLRLDGERIVAAGLPASRLGVLTGPGG